MVKKCKSLLLKIYIRMAQKRYKRLKYIYQREKSKTLVVSFSGFPGNTCAKYNYINTLKEVNAHRLFILDDFGYKKQGSYYLGEEGDWFVPEMVIELIKKIQSENKIEHVVMIGSSKGGTAALYFAIKMEADSCVIGAPQFYLGDYLNIDKHMDILKGIVGRIEKDSIQKLNSILPECISSASSKKPNVYIHYSPMEHTYREHIADLIHELKKYEYAVVEDSNYKYTEHRDVAKFFPLYLTKILKEEIVK